MIDTAILWEWLSFAVRWAHVVAAISWIGTSFYFIALDLGLRKPLNAAQGVSGEEWQVHGGGFYHVQKYMVAPESLPEHVTWFQWESYLTWLTGFALLCVVYYAGAELYLVDRRVIELSEPVAIAISVGSLTIGWILYDLLCKTPLGRSDTGLMVVLFVLLVAMAWGYNQVFTGRAAMIHLGAFTATIMTANVLFIIIPNQRKVVAALLAHETPDPKLGQQAKQRSLHNNYLTLPVIFLMLSVHYPLAFASEFNWLIAGIVFLIGVALRHYFNTYHASKTVKWWPWAAAVALLALIAWVSTWSSGQPDARDSTSGTELSRTAERLTASPHFEQVEEIVLGKCSMCHANEPLWDGIRVAPKGVHLEEADDIVRHAREIFVQAGLSHAMPPGNITQLETDERAVLVEWYRGSAREN